MWPLGSFRPQAGWLTLVFIAPLAAGALRNPELAFVAIHPDLIDRLRKNADRPFMTDRLEHTVLDLAGLETGHLQPQASLFRPEFAGDAKRTLDGKLNFDPHDDPVIGTKANLERIDREMIGVPVASGRTGSIRSAS